MKNVFENPEIKVSLFLTENVITTSGTSTYEDKVKREIGAEGNNLTEKSYTSIFGN
ncbi:MAG: hypothetical protein Q4G33_14295 [bacterium]|nr:hypothetical protein [bacterium]